MSTVLIVDTNVVLNQVPSHFLKNLIFTLFALVCTQSVFEILMHQSVPVFEILALSLRARTRTRGGEERDTSALPCAWYYNM